MIWLLLWLKLMTFGMTLLLPLFNLETYTVTFVQFGDSVVTLTQVCDILLLWPKLETLILSWVKMVTLRLSWFNLVSLLGWSDEITVGFITALLTQVQHRYIGSSWWYKLVLLLLTWTQAGVNTADLTWTGDISSTLAQVVETTLLPLFKLVTLQPPWHKSVTSLSL